VVDALDECETESDIKQVLQLLTDTRGLDRANLRVLVTSRPDIPIRDGFSQFSNDEHWDLVLHDISEFIVDSDISVFLKDHLSTIRPSEREIEQLVRKASGLFIWAATACRFVREGKKFSAKRLATILNSSTITITAPEKHLNEMYITILKHSISLDYTDEEREYLYSMLRHILGSIVVLFSPLSAVSLAGLLDIAEVEVYQTLEDLHAILDIPKDQARPLRLHHPSLRDFLLAKDRCSDQNFWVDESKAHGALADDCIRLMSDKLKKDICGLHASGPLARELKHDSIEPCLPAELQYACQYWVQHLQKSETRLRDDGRVQTFLRQHLLHWFEVLSLMGEITDGVIMLRTLESILTVSGSIKSCHRLQT
jgi:hypothetical protein